MTKTELEIQRLKQQALMKHQRDEAQLKNILHKAEKYQRDTGNHRIPADFNKL